MQKRYKDNYDGEITDNSQELSSIANSAKTTTSAAIISICTIISRITGFLRTWAMAYALGATFISSSYQIANNLPNMLYELVMGGMLTTAFLPVYISLKNNDDAKNSEKFASNLMTIVILALGVLSAVCMLFPSQIVYTQSFYSDQSTMGTAVMLFQFFAIQIVFYGASSVLSGILNANRDYIWGAIAPVFNNIVVIVSFVAYAAIAPTNPDVALYVIAIGSPLGVFVQMAIQIPGLKRNNIRLRPYLNLKDPQLKETISLGLPALLITLFGFITVSVANAASYSFSDSGPSIIAYARLWFTFPYSFLAIPVATTLFTELSSLVAKDDMKKVSQGIMSGSSQIFFLMIPFAMYLMVYSEPLVTLYHVGAFTEEAISQISSYLFVMAFALPFYGVSTFLQMAFSSLRKMGAYSLIILISSAAQVLVMVIATALKDTGLNVSINWIAAATLVSYLTSDLIAFIYLKRKYSMFGLRFKPILKSVLRALVLGLVGAICGALVYLALNTLFGEVSGSIVRALVYVVISGCVSLIFTFGPAIKMDFPEAAFVSNLWKKVKDKIKRRPS